ncbi:MAG: hypothetical protein ACJAT7_002918 [Psychromonas sp.]|jgi:hypothetical protein|uniref:ATP-dependent zinc protease family protein n=1 Tax=Psychromonas sp. TaxID=1884585 RepID=UPI0039E6A210
MFFNKTTLITAFILFSCTGCVNLKNEAQQKQINTLTADLAQTQETNQKTQIELAETSEALQSSQNKIKELDALLIEAKKVKAPKPKPKVKPTPAAVQKINHINGKTLFGQSEWVYISAIKSSYKARIDTGAATSSISAFDIERFERDGEKWVRFNLADDEGNETKLIEAKIERIVRIVQATAEDSTERRYVVKLHVRIGDLEQQTEFTLTDRQHMEYPVLIGRTFLQDVILVDVSKEYIHPQYHAEKE